MKIEIIGDRKMIDFVKKYNLKIEINKEKVFIYNEDGDYMLSIELKDKSIEFDYCDRLKFDFIKDLTKLVEKLV